MAILDWRGPQAVEIIKQAARQGLSGAAIEVQSEAQRTLNREGRGRVYVKRGGRVHVASLPGNPPAKDTGNLGRSVQIDDRQLTQASNELRVRIGTDQPYGRWMEFGTRNIAPRPWLNRSLNQARPSALKRIDQAIRLAISRIRGLAQ